MTVEGPDLPPAAPTSLDPQETSLPTFGEEAETEWHPLDLQSRCQEIAHRRHQGTRRRIVDALWTSQDEPHRKRASRIGSCCACPVYYENSAGEVLPALRRCRDRLCPLCGTRRGGQAAAKCHALIQLFDAPRLITLTQVNRPEPLTASISRIITSFHALQREQHWKSRVRGGVWALEVTRNPTSGHWHAHVHLIVDSDFLPQPLLKAAWLKVTTDSFVVDIRAVHDRREAAKYVAQYVAKPLDVQRWPPEAIREFADALHGKRMLQPFGVAFKAQLDADDNAEPPPEFTEIGPCSRLLDADRAGSQAARTAREILSRMGSDHQIAACWPHDWSKGPPVPPDTGELAYVRHVLRLCSIIDPRMIDAIDARAGVPGVLPIAQPPPQAMATLKLF